MTIHPVEFAPFHADWRRESHIWRNQQ